MDDLNRRCRALRVERGAGERKAGIYNGTVGTVVSTGRERISVRLDGGDVVSFDPAEFDQWGHGYAGTVYRGQGKPSLRCWL